MFIFLIKKLFKKNNEYETYNLKINWTAGSKRDELMEVIKQYPQTFLANQSEDFKNYLYANCTDEAPKLVIDLSHVKYMDSSFIGALVAGLKHVLTKHGEMTLVNVQSDVLALFELTRLDKVFKIYSTVTDAIKSLK